MTTRKPSDGSDIPDDSIIGWLTRTQRECKHGPPRSTKGRPWGIEDTCTCGATTYVLRYTGNDGSGKVRKRWDYWEGRRP